MAFNFSSYHDNIANLDPQDSMHIGGGVPTPMHCFCLEDDDYQNEADQSCSSICSAASTVASEFSSIEAPISFPATASTVSFDFAASLSMQLSERFSACRRAREIQMSAKSCHQSRSCPYEKGSEKLAESKASGSNSYTRACSERLGESNLEEFSLGSGDPWKSQE